MATLVALLPEDIAASLRAETETAFLSDINLDIGRQPHAWCNGQRVFLSGEERRVSRSDIQHIMDQLGNCGTDNRAGLEEQFHRISAIRNREGDAIGLTMRVGRHVQGNADMMADILLSRDDQPASVLLLGEPGYASWPHIAECSALCPAPGRTRYSAQDLLQGRARAPVPLLYHQDGTFLHP